jgi:trans-2,3-dihydro-3-hydroxyanthranilate isomerase
MRRFPFVQIDVFTDQPLCGNGLTVFTDARGLSDAELLAIARETRQAETTFVFPGEPPRVRIFTVSGELPFAGHPTLGTAAVLRATSSKSDITLHLDVGPIPVSFDERGFGEMRQNDPTLGELVSRDEVSALVGLAPEDFEPRWPAQVASTGLPYVIAPVKDLSTLRRARPVGPYARGLYLIAPGQEPGVTLHARMFDRDGEDPATGSAAGACTAWMLHHGLLASELRAVIAQGDDLGRPSRIHVRARREGERITDVRVGGRTVEVGRGELAI